jgi:hypothetical protein
MRFNIISNLSNGAGLERDYKLVRRILEEKGHSVEGVMFDQPPPYPKADVNIWLEILPSPSWGLTVAAIDAAPRNWVIPNPEWWYADLWDRHLPRFEKVICKTRDCTRIFERKAPGRCSFTGFESLDLYEPETERQPTFLHMAGKERDEEHGRGDAGVAGIFASAADRGGLQAEHRAQLQRRAERDSHRSAQRRPGARNDEPAPFSHHAFEI